MIMKPVTVFLVGGCMIPGYKLPATSSLPVQINRFFGDESGVKLKIKSNDKNMNINQIFDSLSLALREKSYDIIIIQFINIQIIPGFRIPDKLKKGTIIHKLVCKARDLEKVLIPEKWRLLFRIKLGAAKRTSGYIPKLEKCIELIQSRCPCTKIFLMTPIAPTSHSISLVQSTFIEHYKKVLNTARNLGAGVIDIFKPLSQYTENEIYQADGYHLTPQGQKVVADAICRELTKYLESDSGREAVAQ